MVDSAKKSADQNPSSEGKEKRRATKRSRSMCCSQSQKPLGPAKASSFHLA